MTRVVYGLYVLLALDVVALGVCLLKGWPNGPSWWP
jgi:hypothetical protein